MAASVRLWWLELWLCVWELAARLSCCFWIQTSLGKQSWTKPKSQTTGTWMSSLLLGGKRKVEMSRYVGPTPKKSPIKADFNTDEEHCNRQEPTVEILCTIRAMRLLSHNQEEHSCPFSKCGKQSKTIIAQPRFPQIIVGRGWGYGVPSLHRGSPFSIQYKQRKPTLEHVMCKNPNCCCPACFQVTDTHVLWRQQIHLWQQENGVVALPLAQERESNSEKLKRKVMICGTDFLQLTEGPSVQHDFYFDVLQNIFNDN